MKEEVPSLGIPDIQLIDANDRATVFVEYADRFDNLLRQGNPEAQRLADQLGLVFTSLIYTLKRSPADVRESRKDWPAAQWEAWSRVERINIGGGRFETHLGKQMAQVAVDRLGEFDIGDVHLKLSDHPQHFPCLGIASTLPDGSALIMDAGHTLIKRVRVEVRDREVTKLEILPPLFPAGFSQKRSLQNELAHGFREAWQGERSFGLSVSVHMNDQGYTLPGSLYSVLGQEKPVREVLIQLLIENGLPVESLEVLHEGKAGRMPFQADAAILLGTSVGGSVVSGRSS